MTGEADRPAWLHMDWVLGRFAVRRGRAVAKYVDFVRAGVWLPSIWEHLRNQIFLDGDAFIERLHKRAPKDSDLGELPRIQRRPVAKPLSAYQSAARAGRDAASLAAFQSGNYTMKQLAEYLGRHYSTVGRVVKTGEGHG